MLLANLESQAGNSRHFPGFIATPLGEPISTLANRIHYDEYRMDSQRILASRTVESFSVVGVARLRIPTTFGKVLRVNPLNDIDSSEKQN